MDIMGSKLVRPPPVCGESQTELVHVANVIISYLTKGIGRSGSIGSTDVDIGSIVFDHPVKKISSGRSDRGDISGVLTKINCQKASNAAFGDRFINNIGP